MTRSANDYQVGGDHYKDMALQPWEVMEAVLSREEMIGFLKGNLLKYSLREGKKEGSDDGAKALHYRHKLQEVLAGADKGAPADAGALPSPEHWPTIAPFMRPEHCVGF